MAIYFVAAGTVTPTVIGTTTVPMPSGYAAGDALILIVTGGTATVATPAGWTLVAAQGAMTYSEYFTVFSKTSTASESSVAITTVVSYGRASILAYRGGYGFEIVPAFTAASSVSATTSAMSISQPNTTIISMYGMNTGARTWTAPASTTTRINAASTASSLGFLIVDETQATPGLSTVRTATLSVTNANSAGSIGLREIVAPLPTAITFVGAGTPGTGTNPVCSVPSGYAAGDLLIITTTGTVTATTPAGWTAIPVVAASYPFTIFFKYASVTEASVTVTMVSVYAKAVMVAYRGAYGFQGASVTASPGVSATTITPNPVYTTQANDVVLSIYSSNIIANTWTPDAATTARVNSPSTASFFGLLLADETQASIGASTPRTATSSPAVTGTAISIAIKLPLTTKTVIISTTGLSTFTIPADFVSLVSVEAIGNGAGGFGPSTPPYGGGSGGAYAKSDAILGMVAGGTAYIQVGSPTYFKYGGASNVPPTSVAYGVLADYGREPAAIYVGGIGGQAYNSIGTVVISGGNGGSTNASYASGGGGGAGGPSGIGANGGSLTSVNTGGGGGGANGGSAGTQGSGGNGPGGQGGNGPGGLGGGGAGANWTLATLAVNGTAGTGGGGGGGVANASPINYIYGANGGTGSIWQATSNGVGQQIGPGGGGGGVGGGNTTGIQGGGGGFPGGGGGGSAGSSGSRSAAGAGVIIFTYSTLPAPGSNFFPLF